MFKVFKLLYTLFKLIISLILGFPGLLYFGPISYYFAYLGEKERLKVKLLKHQLIIKLDRIINSYKI